MFKPNQHLSINNNEGDNQTDVDDVGDFVKLSFLNEKERDLLGGELGKNETSTCLRKQ